MRKICKMFPQNSERMYSDKNSNYSNNARPWFNNQIRKEKKFAGEKMF